VTVERPVGTARVVCGALCQASVRLSVRLSHRSTASAAAYGEFAAERRAAGDID